MRYLHLDVFTSVPFEGNQLAVVPEPRPGLSAAEMQRIANEMAFSETTFVLPRERDGDVRMRIFTPGSELPMAGHPTIGTTFALAREGVIARGRDRFVFECGVGPIPVSLEWDDEGLAFVWMTQPLPSFGNEIGDRSGLAGALGLDAGDLAELPPQVVSCGVPYAFVPLRTRAAVDRVAIDRRALARVFERVGQEEHAIYAFSLERGADDATAYSRMLAPGFGIVEDPATGSACGPLGCYLVYHDAVPSAQAGEMLSLQGVAMKRPSRIHIAIDGEDGAIDRVRVGGKAVMVAEGRLLV